MKLTTKSEYGLLALIDLAGYYGKNLVKAQDIAKRKKIPIKYLEQLLIILNRAGYVQSTRGIMGGYRLAKAPDKICLAEIIRLMDGALAPVSSASKYFYSHTPVEQCQPLLRVFKDIRDYIAEKLEKTTLADLLGKKI
ncbi:MAG: Rrf2 family transcriptional regulator [Candidatus Pacebacteria bacterium]|nr:Rrf2 family transcriptional regulator [Candidatus Paceibacterota bacterium]